MPPSSAGGKALRLNRIRTAAAAACLASILPAAAPIGGAGVGPDSPAAGAAEPAPPSLLDQLAGRARLYERAVLRFTCMESLLEEVVAPDTGAPRSAHESVYRYLLQADGGGLGVSEYRQILARDGVPVRPSPEQAEAPGPPPYLWALLFNEANRSLFRFRTLGEERRGVSDTVLIAFEGALAFEDGRRLAEWSGRIWMDRDHLNPIHLEAEPARQEAVLAPQLEAYRRAFRLGPLRLRPRPRAHALSVDFLETRFGLTFPSQAVWRQQVLDDQGRRLTARHVRQTFADYRFFDIRMEETVEEAPIAPPAP